MSTKSQSQDSILEFKSRVREQTRRSWYVVFSCCIRSTRMCTNTGTLREKENDIEDKDKEQEEEENASSIHRIKRLKENKCKTVLYLNDQKSSCKEKLAEPCIRPKPRVC